MGQALRDFPVQDFSGGLVTNKSDYEMNRNELKRCINYDIDERGRLKRRRGYRQFGNNMTGTFVTPFTFGWLSLTPNDSTEGLFLIFDSDNSMWILRSTTLTATLNTSDTTATVNNNANFGASGTIEIEGDVITYTAKPSATSFTVTASTILKQHTTGASVNQFNRFVMPLNGRFGYYVASLNQLLYVQAENGAVTVTSGAPSAVIATSPAALFAQTYRDKIFVAGSGDSSGAGSTVNYQVNRISWSNVGDPTVWTSTDFFDVEDTRVEMITGLRTYADKLLIFKQNSMFYYNEVQMKQTSSSVGAYNHHVVQEINNVLYTFCPTGVYATNGFTTTKISEPVETILKRFYPTYFDSSIRRVIRNCFASTFEKKYILYLGDITLPDAETATETIQNVALVYDTETKTWSMYSFPQNDFHFFAANPSFVSGGASGAAEQAWQGKEAMFGLTQDGSGNPRVMRMFESLEVGYDSVNTIRGGDITADNISDSVGVAISTEAETPLFDFGNPSWWKKYGSVRALTEQGDFHFSYRLDKGEYITEPIILKNFRYSNDRKKLTDNSGYRMGIRITTNQMDSIGKLNGFIIEDNEAISKQDRK